MDDISVYAQQVALRTCKAQVTFRTAFGEQFDLGLTENTVQEFVRAVFYASLIPDEGRYPEVCLMCYRKGHAREFHFTFGSPYDVAASEIAKLSHAVDHGCHLCVLADEGKLKLGGIQVTILDAMRQFGFSSTRVGNPLKMAIIGPGHIEASCGGIKLIYSAGRIFEEYPLLFSDLMKRLAATVEGELKGRTNGKIESLESIFNELAKEIVNLGHGGLLIFTKPESVREFSPYRETKSFVLQYLLIRYWNNVATLVSEAGGVEKLMAGECHQASPHALAVVSDTTMLENSVRAIGRLAGMDGAIVMDFECNVIAFNAIISKGGSAVSQIQFVGKDGRELAEGDVLKNRGSRHQSAVSFVRRVPDSFAFVISQDGSVSAFHNPGDGRVICEFGLRVQS